MTALPEKSRHLLCVSYHATVPHNTGANVRIVNLLRHLSALHPILLAPAPQEQELPHRVFVPRQAPPFIRQTLGFNPAILGCYGAAVFARAQQALTGLEIAAVQCEHLWSFPLAWRLARARRVPLILVEHNIEVVYVERAYRLPLLAHLTARMERRALAACDRVVVCSEVDARLLAERFHTPAEKIWIVPNGITLPAPRREAPAAALPEPLRGKKLALFLGKTDYPPNAEAIRVLREELAPRAQSRDRDLVFVVVGGPQQPDYSRVGQGLAFTGFVDDLQPLLQHATVCIAPLRSGSGTRLKILEYAAHARPIVATSVAAEGLNFVKGREIVIADDWDEFMQAIMQMVQGTIDGQAMARRAYRKVAEEYQWQTIAAQYQKRLLQLLPGRGECSTAGTAPDNLPPAAMNASQ
ncbi:MAG: glycosyltransferase family 4 protein [candidate division KSB1 bacterium]|nr:glycosyltransferase family 4 protein [candidate division KSB1 bacterium]MDZ7275986.1 glycosyltransferase family 4 protein [candidate division KSB1 bacterium]MDZ7285732.1 glycosyltransferase family 4 protein [candidate division KSB1 bacterium]MDZ7298764.1 glycosyltransferase family 4 protein [candidate division KSB1 bacterium]MDZ7305947.1 glycosyltransferase family 4 protein [candidate division KSB1 bacterium]